MFWKTILFVALIICSAVAVTNKPNVILVFADDISAREIAVYGSSTWSPPPGGDSSDPSYLAETPMMDMMATNGVWFKTAWAAVVCSPSRAMMMTGRYASLHKWWFNADKGVKSDGSVYNLYESSPLLIGQVAKQAGYRTMWGGKTQMNNYNDPVYGFDEGVFTAGEVDGGGANPYTDFELKNVGGILTNIDTGLAVGGAEASGYAQRSWYWYPSVSLYNHPDSPTATTWWPFTPADQAAYGLHTFGPDVVLDHILDFMERSATSNTPFFVYHTSHLGHDAYDWLKQSGSTLKWPGTPIVDWDGTNYVRTTPVITGDAGVYDTHGTVTDMGIHHHIKYLDYQLWQYIEKMKELGIEDNTILIFCADNGTSGYGKASHDRQKGCHVPLIVYAPGLGLVRQGAQDALVNMSDMLPTLAEIAGTEIPANYELHGESFWPYLTDTNATHRDWIYAYKSALQLIRGNLVLKDGNDKWWDVSSIPADLISFPEITDWNAVSQGHRDERDMLQTILPRFDNYALERDPPWPPTPGSANYDLDLWLYNNGMYPHDADKDTDGDDMTNTDEYITGTDPRDKASRFTVSGSHTGGVDYAVAFSTLSNRLYHVEYTKALDEPWTVLATNLAGNGSVIEVFDAIGLSNCFYRTKVELEEPIAEAVRQIFFDGTDGSWPGGTISAGPATNNGAMTWIEYDETPYYDYTDADYGPDVILYGLSQYAGAYADLLGGTNTTWRYNVRDNPAGDDFQWYLSGTPANAVPEQLKYVKTTDMVQPAASIDLTTGIHSVTFGSGRGQTRLAIRNSGNWYVSQTLVDGGRHTFSNLIDENWSTVSIVPGTPFVEPTTFTVDTSAFTNVDAIGWFVMEDKIQRFNLLIYDMTE